MTSIHARRVQSDRGSEPEPPPPVRVLVVDDYPPVRTVTTMLLTSAGYAVQGTHSGEHALSLIMAQPDAFDLLVTDLDMTPGMWGDELVQQVRQRVPGLHVLIMTADPIRLTERARLDWMDVIVLRKPFQVTDLCNAVRQALAVHAP